MGHFPRFFMVCFSNLMVFGLGLTFPFVTTSEASDKFTIYVVNYPLKYFAERIAGDHADVVFPAPVEGDPAYWMPDTRTIEAYQQADLIFLNGANYAKWVRKVSLPRSRMVNTSGDFKDRYMTSKEAVTHSHGPEGAHAHESLAFTTWLDFDLAAKQAEAITKALSRKRPGLRDMFHENYTKLREDLMALDRQIEKIVSKSPHMPLLASHPVYDYFARRYHLNLKSVHWEPDETPTPKQWRELKRIRKTHPAEWMIWEGEPMKATVEHLESIGVRTLVFDPCGNAPEKGDFLTGMRQNVENLLAIWSHGTSVMASEAKPQPRAKGYTGSVSCRECHERFYKLWASSHHGLAMQPYTSELAQKSLTPQTEEIVIGNYRYRADTEPGKGWVLERGPEGDKKYPMVHVLGGKNVYYFLTPMERGRLQTLPVAYDVRRKEWFDTAASGLRHFPDQTEQPVDWKDPGYTFNTACYSCHVSQLSTNYDLKSDTYRTVWTEPGINCETCHGPAEEHIRVCREAPKGEIPRDLKIVRGGRDFTTDQQNASCASCHAKMIPLTTAFGPGQRFFDHFDLATLDNPDYYPDGRDLGENYTYTTWLMSPCAKSGKLSCLHCHTSSGRFRQKNDPNKACMPCHKKRVENAPAHTHHKPDSKGNQCISCHMPMTEFARMRRSDHSMLPPTPTTTMAFKSPNACNLCHKEKDAAWADKWVRKWRKRDYQAPVIRRAGLIEAARKRDWKRLPGMLNYITSKDRDEVYATSLIRLLGVCEDPIKWSAILKATKDPSPLVRGAAAESLRAIPSKETGQALLEATGDDYRLVRVRAAASLASYPRLFASILEEGRELQNLDKATVEFLASLLSRPDQWTSYYNLGNYYMERGDFSAALGAYQTSLRLEPRAVMPMVNASMAFARGGENVRAGEFLEKALQIEPDNAAANFNMGLLKAQEKDPSGAERHLRAALKADPKMHQATYNLGVLLARDRPRESIELCLKAFELRPNPRYGYTLAFYIEKNGDPARAAEMLKLVIEQWPTYIDAYLLLGDIFEGRGRKQDAKALYLKALKNKRVSSQDRFRLEAKLRALSSTEKKQSDKVNKK